MSVMVDANTGRPDVGKVENWANYHDLDHPVLADEDASQGPYVVTGFPTYVVIDREMNIVNEDMWPWNDSTVTSLF